MSRKQTTIEEFDPARVRPLPGLPRQRFAGIEELAASIRRVGQRTPGAVTLVEGDPKVEAQLVDGERRLRACRLAGKPFRAEVVDPGSADAAFVESVASLKGAAYAAPYAASKHGMVGLMRSLAAEFARTSLTVNAVCPSFVDTPMVDDSAARIARVSKRSESEAREALAAMNASGRLVHPDAVATMVLTLCLPQSRDVNGASITIDGGTTA